MMEPEEIVDALKDSQPGDMVYVEADGVEEWFPVESASMNFADSERDAYGWIEGDLSRYLIVPDELQDEMDLVYHSSHLSSRTVDAEWLRPTLTLPERWLDDAEHADDWIGDEREVKSVAAVPVEMWPYREEAVSEAYSFRSDALRRAVYADAVVRYVADERGVDVRDFVQEFEATDLGEILDEYGRRMFPREFDVIDVSERTLADVLSSLRYFSGL